MASATPPNHRTLNTREARAMGSKPGRPRLATATPTQRSSRSCPMAPGPNIAVCATLPNTTARGRSAGNAP
eukprot:6164803-Lingulodinium_polyedra.AAC.1